jgi:5S rRNA maturation endonuclease (ribonuclease M5)
MPTDPLTNATHLDFVIGQLAQYVGQKIETSGRTMVICPYHSENTPSGAINTGAQYAPGYFTCFACGHKAPWNDVAPRLNLLPYGKMKPSVQTSMDLLMERIEDDLMQEQRYKSFRGKRWAIPRNKKWREIPTNLLIELGGEMCRRQFDNGMDSTKFLYLPVMVNGEQEGYFLARLRKSSDPAQSSYLLAKKTTSRGWSRTHGLWPFDHSIRMMREMEGSTVVLVEGQRDCLRLIMNGIPAMCIFGTQSWSDSKAQLLETAGVEKVVLLFDGDGAGIGATKKIKPQLTKWFDTRVYKLWKARGSPYLKFAHLPEPTKAAKKAGVQLWDPFNCPQRIIQEIQEMYFT